MPTLRFEKLKAKKKQLIINSVQDCLERQDISTLSVKDIADEAEISRGTFYTYFADIKDCVFTLIVFYLNQFFEALKIATKQNNGDFFKTVDEQYKFIMDFLSNERCITIIKNIGSTMNFKMAIEYYNDLNRYSEDIYNWFLLETDIGVVLKDRYKIFSFMTLLNNIIVTSIIELSMGVNRRDIDRETGFKLELLANSVKVIGDSYGSSK